VRAPKPGKIELQQTVRTETCHRIYNRHRLPPENPTGHREANCRIAQMHQSHKSPPTTRTSGEKQPLNSIGTIATPGRANKAHRCHLNGTEVIAGNRLDKEALKNAQR
jgi:hypothetical protein